MLDTASTNDLIAALQDSRAEVRARAAAILRDKPDARAVDGLVTALRDTSAGVRHYAASALGRIRDARSVPHLIEHIFEPQVHVRKKVIDALVAIGAPAVEPLLGLLPAIDKSRKWEIVAALGEIGDGRVVETLLAMLQTAIENGDAGSGRKVLDALENTADARVVAPLIHILMDEDAVVRAEAAEVLGIILDARSVDPLIVCLRDKDVFVRYHAAAALGNLGNARAVEPLIALLVEEPPPVPVVKPVDMHVPDIVARALQKFESLSSRTPAVTLAEVAAGALKKIGTPEAMAAVSGWLVRQPAKNA